MLKSTVNFVIYRCLHTFTHPNIGRLLTKGKLYVCTKFDPNNDIVMMEGYNGKGGACCSLDRFNYYFEYVRDIRKKVARARTCMSMLELARALPYFCSGTL
jgi:hypothetical protein